MNRKKRSDLVDLMILLKIWSKPETWRDVHRCFSRHSQIEYDIGLKEGEIRRMEREAMVPGFTQGATYLKALFEKQLTGLLKEQTKLKAEYEDLRWQVGLIRELLFSCLPGLQAEFPIKLSDTWEGQIDAHKVFGLLGKAEEARKAKTTAQRKANAQVSSDCREFREGGRPKGKLLTPKYIKVRFKISRSWLSRNEEAQQNNAPNPDKTNELMFRWKFIKRIADLKLAKKTKKK